MLMTNSAAGSTSSFVINDMKEVEQLPPFFLIIKFAIGMYSQKKKKIIFSYCDFVSS